MQMIRSQPQIGIPLSKINKSKTYHDAYSLLAQALQYRLSDDSFEVDVIASALKSLSKAQATLKKIDGTGEFLLYHAPTLLLCANPNTSP